MNAPAVTVDTAWGPAEIIVRQVGDQVVMMLSLGAWPAQRVVLDAGKATMLGAQLLEAAGCKLCAVIKTDV